MRLRSTRLTAIASAARRLFNPKDLFAAGEQGAWYDPSDLTTLYQDSAGTTPVTAVEQPVGLMLDKSKGLVLGPELVTNGGFDDGTGWALVGSGVSITGGSLVFNSTSNTHVSQSGSYASGRVYKVVLDVVSYVRGAPYVSVGGGAVVFIPSPSVLGSKTVYVVAGSDSSLRVYGGTFSAGGEVTFDNISVRELPGNHAFQSTAASRPVLSARVNLLTKTEQFDDAVWDKSAFSSSVLVDHPNPFGAQKSWLFVPSTALSAKSLVRADTMPAAHTKSVLVKAKEYRYVQLNWAAAFSSAYVNFDVLTGQATVESGATGIVKDYGNGWYLISASVVGTAAATTHGITVIPAANSARGQQMSGDGTSGIYIWGADLRVSNDGVNIPAYQRVNTATDYDTANFPLYLRADGVDDGMVTNSINFGIDKVTVWAGVRKLSDAARGLIVELGNNQDNNFVLDASADAAGNPGQLYRLVSRGTIPVFAVSPATFTAPITNVLTAVGNISGDSAILRVNGTQAASSTADQGTGNYGAYPLYLFRRGGTTLPFNGRFYGAIIRGAQSTPAQITSAENWLNSKTKAY